MDIPFDRWVAKTTEINNLLDHISDLLQARHACVTPDEQMAVETHIEAARLHLVELRNELARELDNTVRNERGNAATG